MTSPSAPPSAPPRRLRALLLLLLVFCLGAASGIGGGLILLQRLAHRAWAGEMGEKSPMELVTQSLERQMSDELDLTPAERRAVQRELAVTVLRFRDLRTRLRADSREIVEDTLTRLEKHLPPEKTARLRERAGSRLRPWGLMQ